MQFHCQFVLNTVATHLGSALVADAASKVRSEDRDTDDTSNEV